MKRLTGIFIFSGLMLALTPATIYGWTRIYGGSAKDFTHWGHCGEQTSDGGYVVLGTTWSFGTGRCDFWLIKTDYWGDTVWTRTYGGTEWDEGHCVQQTEDGGYVITGESYSSDYGMRLWLLKINNKGDIIWTRYYDGSGRHVQQTSDGGYIVIGRNEDTWEYYLLKTDVQGDSLWAKDLGGAGLCVQQTADGGYIVTGYCDHPLVAGDALWLLKTDSQGNSLWERKHTYGGGDWPMDGGYSVQQTLDGGYIVAGGNSSNGEGLKLWLLKTDAEGDTLWTKDYGEETSTGFGVSQTSDGGYIVTGYTVVPEHGWWEDLWLLKTDAEGDTLWTVTLGENGREYGSFAQETSDGHYIVFGSWNDTDTASVYTDRLRSSLPPGGGDICLIKTDSLGDTTTVFVSERPFVDDTVDWEAVTSIGQQIVLKYTERPNGFHVSVFNASGQRMDELHTTGASGTITWGEGQTLGVYFIRELSDSQGTTRKVVLIQ